MTTFGLDDNFNLVRNPTTEQDLSDWANAYQKKYFTHQSSPDVKIAVRDNIGGVACFDIPTKTAFVEKFVVQSEKFSRIALLHEMIHINLFQATGDPDANHGLTFRQEIQRLFAAGAYANLL